MSAAKSSGASPSTGKRRRRRARKKRGKPSRTSVFRLDPESVTEKSSGRPEWVPVDGDDSFQLGNRFHARASDSLNREVCKLNEDRPGPQKIRVLKFRDSKWIAVESLTRGGYYYHNREEEKEQRNKPSDLTDESVVRMDEEKYTIVYASRPSLWPIKRMKLVTLKTNTFLVKGPILDTTVYQYELSFDPAIEAGNSSFREKVVLGANHNERKRNGDLLRKQFGEFQFDNYALYSMRDQRADHGINQERGPIIMSDLNPAYKVIFHCIDTFKLGDPIIPIQQQEALLNIFNHQKLQSAGYNRIGRGWFLKKSNNGGIKLTSKVESCPDVCVIPGFECSMRILPIIETSDLMEHIIINTHKKYDCPLDDYDRDGHEITLTKDDISSSFLHSSSSASILSSSTLSSFLPSNALLPESKYGIINMMNHSVKCLTVFKADLSHKLVEFDNVNSKLLRMKEKHPRDWQERANHCLIGKHFLLNYTKKNMQIRELDFFENENSTFELQNGGRISYKDYLRETYGVKSPSKELCVIRDRDGAAYLPQHMRLTLTSKETDALSEEILNAVNPSTQERLMRISNFVQTINEAKPPGYHRTKHANTLAHFEIESDSLTSVAMVLEMPRIMICGERGPMRPIPVDELNYRYTRGFLGKQINLSKWGVVFEDTKKGNEAFENLIRNWQIYCYKRRFDPRDGPISRPRPRPIHDILDRKLYHSLVTKGDQFLMLILPLGIRGSEAKSRITRWVQHKDFFNPVKVQCILEPTCRKKNECISALEDLMLKMGNVLYRIVPQLPNKERFIDINHTWVCGMDVSHVKRKPSTAMMSLIRDPFEGSLRTMHLVAHLNPCRKEIVPFENMVSMFYHLLSLAFDRLDPKEYLPKNIIIFRDGVADGQLAELMSKEMCGIQRALLLFRKKKELRSVWKPKIMYIACNKSSLDRFASVDKYNINDVSQVRPLEVPCVIYDHVLSYRLWDFIVYPFHKAKKGDRTRGVRYIVLLDQLKLAKKNDKGSVLDLFQFIFGMTYMYAFSLPFPLGGTAQPSPVQYAKHYAEHFSQLILDTDLSLKHLILHNALDNRPKIVYENILELERIHTRSQPSIQLPHSTVSLIPSLMAEKNKEDGPFKHMNSDGRISNADLIAMAAASAAAAAKKKKKRKKRKKDNLIDMRSFKTVVSSPPPPTTTTKTTTKMYRQRKKTSMSSAITSTMMTRMEDRKMEERKSESITVKSEVSSKMKMKMKTMPKKPVILQRPKSATPSSMKKQLFMMKREQSVAVSRTSALSAASSWAGPTHDSSSVQAKQKRTQKKILIG